MVSMAISTLFPLCCHFKNLQCRGFKTIPVNIAGFRRIQLQYCVCVTFRAVGEEYEPPRSTIALFHMFIGTFISIYTGPMQHHASQCDIWHCKCLCTYLDIQPVTMSLKKQTMLVIYPYKWLNSEGETFVFLSACDNVFKEVDDASHLSLKMFEF